MNLGTLSRDELLVRARAKKHLQLRAEAAKLESSLIEFYKASWPVFDPAPYVHGWHLEAIAEHLEAVSRGEIRKLLITMPPRHSKTLMTSVVWPAWLWAKEKDPRFPLIGAQTRFLCLSYGDDLALDSALLMRRLVESEWFQTRWGKRVKLQSDQEAKSKFDTSVGGSRISAGFGGTLTGRGGDIKIIDDPLKADDEASEVKRLAVLRRYDGTLKSRITDPRTNAEVVIAQRLHEQDLPGHIIETDPDFEHLMLPAEFEPERRFHTSIGWTDPRTDEGELLWPQRFGRKELAQYKVNPYEWAGQWMQRPEIRGGSIIKREYWQDYTTDDGKVPACSYVVASLDPAYEERKENDPSGFTVWGVWYDDHGHSRMICLTAWRKRLEIQGEEIKTRRLANETEPQWVKRTQPEWGLIEWLAHSCKKFRVDNLLIENKASGKSVAQMLRKLNLNQNWGVQLVEPVGDKVARAYAVQHMFAEGMIHLPAYSDGQYREWGQMLVDECASFPKGATDDLVDSTTQALKHIRDRGLAVRRDERSSEMNAMRSKSQKPAQPLYPT
jgi:predicted phage terminase large subunit-like protein